MFIVYLSLRKTWLFLHTRNSHSR